MPYSITTKDGITIQNIPDDVPPDAPELKERVRRLRESSGALEPPPETTAEGVAGGAVRGLTPVAAGTALGALAGAPFAGVGAVPGAVAGAAAGGLAQIAADPVVSAVNKLFGTTYQMPTDALADLLTRVGVAEPRTQAERIVQTTAAGAGGAGGGVALGKQISQLAGAQYPTVARIGGALEAQPAAQLAGGAGAGLGGQTSAELGAGEEAQLAAALAAGMAGAKLGGVRVEPRAGAQTPQIMREAAQADIPVMTTDVAPPRTFVGRWLQSSGERIPLAGTGGKRAAQQGKRVDAVKEILRRYGADKAAAFSDDVMADLAATRSQKLDKYTGMKAEVIDRLGDAGAVPVPKTMEAIDREITRLSSLRTQQVQPVIDRLEDWRMAIASQNLPNVELLRKQVGESFADPNLAAIRTIGEKSLSSIYPALREDMGGFIDAVGQPRDKTRWKVANRRLSDMASEIKKGALKAALSKGNTQPEAVEQLLFSSKRSDVRALFRNLSEEGKRNARAAVLARAKNKAINADDSISPDRFANEVKRLGSSVGVFFEGDDLQAVNGLARVINATKRAMESAANPPTGVQVAIPVGAAVLTDLLGGYGAALFSGAGLGGLARAYESAPVRDLLLKIPQVAKGSKEEAQLIKRAIAVMAAEAQTPVPNGD